MLNIVCNHTITGDVFGVGFLIYNLAHIIYHKSCSGITSWHLSNVIEKYFTFDMTWSPCLFLFFPIVIFLMAYERDTRANEKPNW